MPTIPTIQRQGARSVRAVAADVGQGLTQAGRAVLMIDEQMQQARKSRELNEVVTEATRRIAENEDTLKADPGAFTTWSEQQREFLTTTRSELSDSLGDAEVRDLFNQKFNTMGVHSETRIRQGARGREIDEGRSAIAAMEDVLSDNYATLASGVDRQAVLDGVEAAFDEGKLALLTGDRHDGQGPLEIVGENRSLFHGFGAMFAAIGTDQKPLLVVQRAPHGEYRAG